MKVPVSLPLDNDGFLRRECPSCARQFKWHYGPASEEAENQPSAVVFYCPFCGVAAATDQWFTTQQVEYIRGAALPSIMQALDDELEAAFRGTSGKNFSIKKTGSIDVPDVPPDPMVEPDDMTIVASPCHAWEPIKVPEDAVTPLYCLVCGQPFAL